MRKFTDYKPLTLEELARLFVLALPCGKVWDAKNVATSNLYLLIKSLTSTISVLEDRTYRLARQWDIRITEDLITEWEVAVGIPDECRKRADDLATRRKDVITKLRRKPIITVADYKELAEVVTGEPANNWNIRPGITDYPDLDYYRHVLLITPPVVTWSAFSMPFGSRLSITSLTSSGTTVTAEVSDTSTMEDGSVAVISGAEQTEYNIAATIHVVDGTHFTYSFLGSTTSPATGSPEVCYGLNNTKIDSMKEESTYLLKAGVAFQGYPFAEHFRTSVLRCVFRKITPANVAIVFT